MTDLCAIVIWNLGHANYIRRRAHAHDAASLFQPAKAGTVLVARFNQFERI